MPIYVPGSPDSWLLGYGTRLRLRYGCYLFCPFAPTLPTLHYVAGCRDRYGRTPIPVYVVTLQYVAQLQLRICYLYQCRLLRFGWLNLQPEITLWPVLRIFIVVLPHLRLPTTTQLDCGTDTV